MQLLLTDPGKQTWERAGSWHRNHHEAREASLSNPTCPPPVLRGQQQLHLQLCGLNRDSRGAEDEVESDLPSVERQVSQGRWVLRTGHSDRETARYANLGTSLHRVPQLTLDMRGILIGQAERLLLDQGGKDRSVWVTESLKVSSHVNTQWSFTQS